MISDDGLLSTNNSENFHHVVSYNQICREHENKKNLWIKKLREQGFKAAHPNDGWVNREENYFQLGYPQFNDGISVGNKVMLGWGENDGELPIEITEIKESKYFAEVVKYYFKKISANKEEQIENVKEEIGYD